MRPQYEIDRVMARLNRVLARPNFPVEVRWARLRHLADTSFDEDRRIFVIRLSRKGITTRAELIDTLIHEKAHTLIWFSTPTNHGPEWGVAFARVYRAFHSER